MMRFTMAAVALVAVATGCSLDQPYQSPGLVRYEQQRAAEKEAMRRLVADANSLADFVDVVHKNRRSFPQPLREETITIRLREWYLEVNHDLQPWVREMIQTQQVRPGMIWHECMASWGVPCDINSTVTGYGTSEQWVYQQDCGRYGYSDCSYLYFDDRVLRTIQD